MQSAEIRRRFLAWFETRGHSVVPSASLVSDDPTTLFTMAGMQPFKPYLLGQVPPPWPRATSVQKVVRTPDIDIVGTTSRHVTFFEMCGNFSFGDYFKADAIPLAWGLLTTPQDQGGYGMDPERLWVTVFETDDEAADIWQRSVGLPPERLQRLGMADNFWSMGVPGPCGPDSEIFYDQGPEHGPGGGPVADDTRYVEIWNLVFMSDERGAGQGEDFPILGPLPARNIDTGMGLDRVAFLLQGKADVFGTDLLSGVLDTVAEITGHRLGTDQRTDVSLRVIADHSRTATFLIADGVTPGNEGKGYVLRRLLRRAVRNMRLLGADQPALGRLVDAVRDSMGAGYPELVRDHARIRQVAETEEIAFTATLASGTRLFDGVVAQVRAAGGTALPGERAFALHDTYGFPIDLTLEMAREQGLTVDEAGFRALMGEQRARAKADRAGRGIGNADVGAYRPLLAGGPVVHSKYDELHTETTVRGLLRGGQLVDAAGAGEVIELVLERTPFYAESGGQAPDAGRITGAGLDLEVLDVQAPVRGLVVHQVRVVAGELRAGQEVLAAVDPEWRLGACQAHSGTHVVHAALRQVLGPSALQSGSANRPGYLRLDFAWPAALSRSTRTEVEEVANLAVRRDLPVQALLTSLADARAMGALALFGETYDETVRVIEIGGPWSRELCGGTHVAHSSQIGPLALVSEGSVGSGLRRVEALTGIEGFRYLAAERDLVSGLAESLKAPADQVAARVQGLLERTRELEREVERLRSSQLSALAAEVAARGHDVFGVLFVSFEAPAGTGGDALRTLALDVRGRLPTDAAAVVVVGARGSGQDAKGSLVVATNDHARGWGLLAGDLVTRGTAELGGRGGGRDDVAQGGGPDGGRVAAALTSIEHLVGAKQTGSA